MKELDKYNIIEAKDHWLEIHDKEGWFKAIIKWDGCIHLDKFSNTPFTLREKDEDDSCDEYHHICDIQREIEFLYSLLKVAREHYKNHHYYDEAWEREPNLTPQE